MNELRDVEWDVFISHASEDKDAIARLLAIALQERGLRVWYDEFTLHVGDSLRRSIDNGLSNSRFGVVILSPNFFAKEWPQEELDGLTAKERDGVKVILPIWHEIERAEIVRFSPMLAGRLAARSSRGVEHVVDELLKAMNATAPVKRAGLEPVRSSGRLTWPQWLLEMQPIKGYYRRPQIPRRRLENALRSCRVPGPEKVVALIDCTDSVFFWNWGRQAIILSESGVYFSDGSESGFFTYDECREHRFSCFREKISLGRPGQVAHMYHINMPHGTMSYMSAFWLADPDTIVDLLQRIGEFGTSR
jgi:hypothetical protein